MTRRLTLLDVTEEQEPETTDHAADEKPGAPRIKILRGAKPWRIDPSRRERWSSEDFVRQHASAIRQVGDPVLHSPAKKPTLPRAEMEALVARMFASMVAARGIGIAAPQIGVPLRVAIIDVDSAGI